MLIPFGILSAGAGGQPFEGIPAYDFIATTTGAGVNTFDFSSIPQTYKHLQIRWLGKSNQTDTSFSIRFNGDTGNNYSMHTLQGQGGSVTSSGGSSQSRISLTNSLANNTTGNAFAAGVADILDYTNTSKNTTLRTLLGRADAQSAVHLTSGAFLNTAAITQITIFATNNFNGNSRFSLYGIKG
jgi:hypothetical protein